MLGIFILYTILRYSETSSSNIAEYQKIRSNAVFEILIWSLFIFSIQLELFISGNLVNFFFLFSQVHISLSLTKNVPTPDPMSIETSFNNF